MVKKSSAGDSGKTGAIRKVGLRPSGKKKGTEPDGGEKKGKKREEERERERDVKGGAIHILAVDDQPEVLEELEESCEEYGCTMEGVRNSRQALDAIADEDAAYDMVLLDYNLGAGSLDGLQLLSKVKARRPDLPVVMVTGEGNVERAVDAMKAGAEDFIEKTKYMGDTLGLLLEKMKRRVTEIRERKALEQEVLQARDALAFYRSELYRKYAIVGQSEPIRTICATIEKVAPIPRPVLVLGERGSGKELVAAAIHKASPRAEGPFVVINCAAFSEGLLECELFGQEENAYNNAPFRRGRFELAHKGTLFLDEVANMPVEFQQKVLRVIEYQEFQRVGGSAPIRVDVRIVAATNADMQEEMATGRFREDLYDRLAFETLLLPPLRERPSDVPLLVRHFLALLRQEVPSVVPEGFTRAAEAQMAEYPWPGNVRELKFYVERMAYKLDCPVIDARDLPPPEPSGRVAVAGLREQLAGYEKALIRWAWSRSEGDELRAAELLRLTVDELNARRKHHDIR